MLKYLEEAGEAMILAEQGNRELARVLAGYVRRLFGSLSNAGASAPGARA